MACCKANIYGRWCQNEKTSQYDDGEEYCIFHAPKDNWKDVESFNESVFQRIRRDQGFSSNTDLRGTIFPGPISFKQFNEDNPFPKIDFGSAEFEGEANFTECTFGDRVNFIDCFFQGRTLFINSCFRGQVDFLNCDFEREVLFIASRFNKRIQCLNCDFRDTVAFGGAIFSGFTIFQDCEFQKDVSFVASNFKSQAVFAINVFSGITQFSNLRIDDSSNISFRELSFENSWISFLDTDLTKIRFNDCTLPQTKVFALASAADILPDEIEVERSFSDLSIKTKFLNYSKCSKSYMKVGTLYRQLKQQSKEDHNEAEASKWHYREKEMFRKAKQGRRYIPFSFTTLYWLFSGYGERPIRAGVMLLFFLAACTLFMNFSGLTASDPNIYGLTSIQGFSLTPDWTKFWLLVQNTAQYSLFIKNPDFVATSLSGKIFLLLFSRLLVPIQATLFVFALRNKFRR